MKVWKIFKGTKQTETVEFTNFGLMDPHESNNIITAIISACTKDGTNRKVFIPIWLSDGGMFVIDYTHNGFAVHGYCYADEYGHYEYDLSNIDEALVLPVLYYDTELSSILPGDEFVLDGDPDEVVFRVITRHIIIPVLYPGIANPFGFVSKDDLAKDTTIENYVYKYIPELRPEKLHPLVNVNVCDEIKFDDTRNDIINRFEAARIKDGMTQEELGLKVGCTEKFIDEIEKGVRTIAPGTFDSLCRAMNTSPGFILCGDCGCAAEPLNELFQLLCYRSMEEKMIALDVVKAIFKYDGFKFRKEK